MYFNIIYNNNIELINISTKIAYNFCINNIQKVINDDRFNGNKKYHIICDILSIYMDIYKDILRYNDRILISQYKFKSDSTCSDLLQDSLDISKSLLKYIEYKRLDLKSFIIDGYISDEISTDIIEYHTKEKNDKEKKLSKYLFKYLDDFKNYECQLFNIDKFHFYSKSLKDPTFIYDKAFEDVLERYVERVKYAELEKIKIKYGNNININHSLRYIENDIYNYVAECRKTRNSLSKNIFS